MTLVETGDPGPPWRAPPRGRSAQAVSSGQFHAAGSTIEAEGADTPRVRVMLSGWAACCRTLADGRRQILRLVLPREVLVTCSETGPSVCTAVALTASRTADLGPMALLLARETSEGRRLQQFVRSAMRRDQARLLTQVVRLGRMTAYERTAHLLLELQERFNGCVARPGSGMEMPLTQASLSDLLGLSLVHVNRTLQQLRAEGLIAYSAGRVTFLDPDAMAKACTYQPSCGAPDPPTDRAARA